MTRTRPLARTRTLLPLAYRRIVYLMLLWLAGGVAPAFAAAAATPKGEIRAAVLYHNYCSVCHGDKGDGRSRAQNSLNPPPRDFTTPAASQLTRASMIDAVKNGRPGTAMTPWKSQLSDKEIVALVDYMRNTFLMASYSDDSSRGRAVYSRRCSVCHGEKGDGRSRAQNSLNPPPRDFTAPGISAQLTKQRMITSVTYGRPETAMAGYQTKLSKEDINAVVDYIIAGFMGGATSTQGISGISSVGRPPPADTAKAATAATAAPAVGATPAQAPKPVAVSMSAPMPNGLKGNIFQGESFYMANCATCHGNTGDGRGPRAYFINPKPRNFLHPATRDTFNRVALFDMIAKGTLGSEMPAWDKVLSPQEIADVTEFVFQRFIQPGAQGTKAASTAKKP